MWFHRTGAFLTTKGQYIEPGTVQLIADMPSLRIGWCRWKGGHVVEEITGLVGAGYKPPPRYKLDHYEWEDGRDPWQLTHHLNLIWPGDGTQFLFTTSTKGGDAAVRELAGI
jgi:hypothetical protein